MCICFVGTVITKDLPSGVPDGFITVSLCLFFFFFQNNDHVCLSLFTTYLSKCNFRPNAHARFVVIISNKLSMFYDSVDISTKSTCHSTPVLNNAHVCLPFLFIVIAQQHAHVCFIIVLQFPVLFCLFCMCLDVFQTDRSYTVVFVCCYAFVHMCKQLHMSCLPLFQTIEFVCVIVTPTQ